MNLASQYLREHNETIEDWDGLCGELANEICRSGDHILYVEGDIYGNYILDFPVSQKGCKWLNN